MNFLLKKPVLYHGIMVPAFLLLGAFCCFTARTNAQLYKTNEVAILQHEQTIGALLQEISKQTGYQLSYINQPKAFAQPMVLAENSYILDELLNSIMSHSNLEFQKAGGSIIVREVPKGNIRGHILTSDGKNAEGVEVYLSGNRFPVYTDSLGDFDFGLQKLGKYNVTASLVGLQTQIKPVMVQENEPVVISFLLKEDQLQLAEVRVRSRHTGIGVQASDYVAKIPLHNVENAQVYSTVTNKLMDQQAVFGLADAMKNVPGVYAMGTENNDPNGFGSMFYIRGISSINGEGYAVNGMASSTNLKNGGDMNNVESVEVLKGPSATLFGNNVSGSGGFINIVTKKPHEYTGGEIHYMTGTYGLNRVAFDINTPLDKNKDVLFRMNGVYSHTGTFQDYGYKQTIGLAPSFLFKLNDRMKLSLDLNYQHIQSSALNPDYSTLQVSSYKSTISGLLSSFGLPAEQVSAIMATYPASTKEAYGTNNIAEMGIDYKKSYGSNQLPMNTSIFSAMARLDNQLSNNWRTQTVFSSSQNTGSGTSMSLWILPNFIASVASTGKPAAGGADNAVRLALTKDIRGRNIDIQHNFIGDFRIGSLRNRFVGGLDYYHEVNQFTDSRINGKVFSLPYAGAFDVIPLHGNVYRNFNQTTVDSVATKNGTTRFSDYSAQSAVYSAYFNNVLNVTDRLIASFGFRLDYFDNKGTHYNVTDTTTGKYHQTAFPAPKLGLIYEILKDRLSAFANYQNSFRNTNGADYYGKSFKPTENYQWEAGFKADLVKDFLTGTVSYYHIKGKNQLSTDNLHPGFNIQMTDSAYSVSKGVDIDLSANPIKGMDIVLGYSYNNYRYYQAGENVTYGEAPKNQLNYWGNYEVQTGSLKGLGIGFGGNSVSRLNVQNGSGNNLYAPGYTVLNGALSYTYHKCRLLLKLNNVANKHAWTGWASFSPLMPRQLVADFAFRF